MPGVDRQRAFSTSSGGSNGEPRRLSRGKLIGAICGIRKRKLAWSMMMNRILSFSRLLVFFLVSFPFFKQACPWRNMTNRTSDDFRLQSTTSCHRFRQRNKYIRPSAQPDGTNKTLRFRHISIQIRACISLTFRLISSSLRRDGCGTQIWMMILQNGKLCDSIGLMSGSEDDRDNEARSLSSQSNHVSI